MDENGFRHFEGPPGGGAGGSTPDGGTVRNGFRRRVPPDVSTWWSDLARQVGKDLGMVVLEE